MTITQRKNLKVYSNSSLTTTSFSDIALNYSHLVGKNCQMWHWVNILKVKQAIKSLPPVQQPIITLALSFYLHSTSGWNTITLHLLRSENECWLWVFHESLHCTNLSGQDRAPGWVNLFRVPQGLGITPGYWAASKQVRRQVRHDWLCRAVQGLRLWL